MMAHRNTDSAQVDGQLPYERLNDPKGLRSVISLRTGERLLVRHAFRWHLDGDAIPNCYEMFEREAVCAEKGWEVVHSFGPHIAVVRMAQPDADEHGGVE